MQRRVSATISRTMRDERGASLVIALVFFLICAIVGSVVLTAASTQAKSVHTYYDLQQSEFAVSSAAQTLGAELESAVLTRDEATSDTETPQYVCNTGSAFAKSFWTANGATIMNNRRINAPTEIDNIEVAPNSTLVDAVQGTMTIDEDLNIKVELSLAEGATSSSDYRLVMTLQCIPTYDSAGSLIAFEYEPAVVSKVGDEQ